MEQLLNWKTNHEPLSDFIWNRDAFSWSDSSYSVVVEEKIEAKFFLYGLILWVIAISPKYIMDLTLTNPLFGYLKGFGDAVYVILSGLYVGLRTGLLESGLSYLIILKTKIKEVNLNQAIALGIGFGSTEALFIGFSSSMSTLVFLLYPDLINKIPESRREVILQHLNQSS